MYHDFPIDTRRIEADARKLRADLLRSFFQRKTRR